MTRKISQDIAAAFKHRRVITRDNTTCTGDEVILFGNKIAWRDLDTGMIWTTLAGWPRQTTRDRLNAICETLGFGRPYYHHKGEPWYDGRSIDAYDEIPLCGPLSVLAHGWVVPANQNHDHLTPVSTSIADRKRA